MNKPIYQFLVNKWYFDELYDYLFVKSFKKTWDIFMEKSVMDL